MHIKVHFGAWCVTFVARTRCTYEEKVKLGPAALCRSNRVYYIFNDKIN